MDLEDTFILEEYRNANQLTYHIDNIRNSLTNFYFVLVGIVSAAFFGILRENALTATGVGATLSLLIGVIGLIDVLILARLRSVQLEYFRILNNIRDQILGTNLESRWRKTIELSSSTLPLRDKPTSGSHYWVFSIILINTSMLEVAIYLLLLSGLSCWVTAVLVGTSALAIIFTEEGLYFKISKPRRTK